MSCNNPDESHVDAEARRVCRFMHSSCPGLRSIVEAMCVRCKVHIPLSSPLAVAEPSECLRHKGDGKGPLYGLYPALYDRWSASNALRACSFSPMHRCRPVHGAEFPVAVAIPSECLRHHGDGRAQGFLSRT
ncbi:hypothetical protein MTO96_036700 [Rhipicephalus appendiculatus]